jgi:hypothetical protein
MKWSDEMQEWCHSPRTQEAVKTLHQAFVTPRLDELLQACAHSSDPNVRAQHASYFMAQQIVGTMKGNRE